MDLNLHYPKIYRAREHVCGVGGFAVLLDPQKETFACIKMINFTTALKVSRNNLST